MSTIVGMGEILIKRNSGTLHINGLGSCVGLSLYDPEHKVAGLAHIMLPNAPSKHRMDIPTGKYADIAVPELIKQMREKGADKKYLQAKIVGGAQMFPISNRKEAMPIGERNVKQCKLLLSQWSIPVIGEDTGGNYGRSLTLYCDTGKLQVRNSKLGMKTI